MAERGRLSTLAVNDDGFLFDQATGSGYVANPTAVAIVRGLHDGRTDDEIVDELTTQFAVASTQAAADLAEFVGRLKTLGMLNAEC